VEVCDFFWKEKYDLVETYVVDLTKEWCNIPCTASMCTLDPTFAKKLEQTTTATQLALLHQKSTQVTCDVCVANVHLYSNPHAPHIRLLQTAVMTAEIERKYKQSAVIYCGDFNAGCESGACEFLRNGKIP